MSANICSACGLQLIRETLQLRSDDEAPALVLRCPTHGIHHDTYSKYNATTEKLSAIVQFNPSRRGDFAVIHTEAAPVESCGNPNMHHSVELDEVRILCSINTTRSIPCVTDYVNVAPNEEVCSWSSTHLCEGHKVNNGKLWFNNPILSC